MLDIMKMVLVVALVSLPPVSVGGRGEGLETGGYLMDLEVGATSSQLDGHGSTHRGALEVWLVVQGTTQDLLV